ncbi:MAG: uncharacterized protein KVP18_001630, partial [Porospora cf. gigantea A]|uniref:uncharacterized protein n=2 Tax=Porospora cf. gigantea A TaxID=2853593 RepID=UPI00355A5010
MYALTTGPSLDSDFRSEVRKYQDYRAVYEDFLRNFEGEDAVEPHGRKLYLNQLQEVADGRRESVHVEVQHFAEFTSGLPEEKSGGLNCLVENAFKAHTLMMEAAIAVKRSLPRSAHALLARQVFERMEMATDQLPAVLRASFDVYLSPPSSTASLELRSVKSDQIGRLVRLQCIVAKCSSVKPRMAVARYRCQDCGTDAFQPVNGKVFTPKMACDGQRCRDASRRGTLRLIQKECRFRKHETVLVQEPTKHVPPGGVPRYMDVVVEGGLTRHLSPGMEVTLGGILVPLETTHIYGKDGNIQRTQFEVHSIEVHKKAYTSREESTLDELNAELSLYDMDPNIYDRLANSLAPAIHGLLDVKKALLLQLVGGTSESFDDGLKLRGDIHILLMGDPGVAKSQLLSKVAQIAPRSHYATGKGASGVGLTAAVTKDPTTGEFALEAGAIVLSDKGICCIDEFDKMDERDRTSIHEVMEQQTVSVAKAGLTATLNARTSILAAANPISGRYDLRKSVVRNINLPAALLSRFDLQFILLDQADMDTDSRIALHILKQHQEEGETREVYEDVLPVETLRKF